MATVAQEEFIEKIREAFSIVQLGNPEDFKLWQREIGEKMADLYKGRLKPNQGGTGVVRPTQQINLSTEFSQSIGRITNHGELASADQTLRAQFERLLQLMELSDQERAFIRAASNAPTDKSIIVVFADWLEDHGKMEAERMRQVAEGMK